jgi:hypothetical protein
VTYALKRRLKISIHSRDGTGKSINNRYASLVLMQSLIDRQNASGKQHGSGGRCEIPQDLEISVII